MTFKEILILCAIVGIIIIVSISRVFIQPYMEAKTYNKLTGKNVTMWDAMWVDLRVQENIKE